MSKDLALLLEYLTQSTLLQIMQDIDESTDYALMNASTPLSEIYKQVREYLFFIVGDEDGKDLLAKAGLQ